MVTRPWYWGQTRIKLGTKRIPKVSKFYVEEKYVC